jgi:hypothetical protein
VVVALQYFSGFADVLARLGSVGSFDDRHFDVLARWRV